MASQAIPGAGDDSALSPYHRAESLTRETRETRVGKQRGNKGVRETKVSPITAVVSRPGFAGFSK
jgi:hypothetical protein